MFYEADKMLHKLMYSFSSVIVIVALYSKFLERHIYKKKLSHLHFLDTNPLSDT